MKFKYNSLVYLSSFLFSFSYADPLLSSSINQVLYSDSSVPSFTALESIDDPSLFIKLPKIIPQKGVSKINLSDADIMFIAINNSTSIKSAVYQYQQQIYSLREAYSSYYPQFSLYSTGLNQSQNYANQIYGENFFTLTETSSSGMVVSREVPGSFENILSYSNSIDAMAGLEITFDIFDMTRDLDIAEEMEMKDYYYNLLIESIKSEILNVKKDILSVKINREFITLYSKASDFAKRSSERTNLSYKGGFSTLIDVDNNFAQYKDYQAKVATYLGSEQTALSSLLATMSWPEYTELTLNDRLVIDSSWPLSLETSLILAERQNEQIQNLLIQSQKSFIAAQNKLYDYLPVISLNLNGSASKGKGELSLGWPYSSTDYNTDSSVSLSASMTIFDGFANLNASRSLKNEANYYLEQKNEKLFSIQSDVASNIATIKANSLAFKLNNESFLARKQVTELTNIGYESGYNTVFDLIQAQQNTVQSQEDKISNVNSVNLSFFTLESLTGSYDCNIKISKLYCSILKNLGSSNFSQLPIF